MQIRYCPAAVSYPPGKLKPLVLLIREGVCPHLDNKSEDLPVQVVASLEEGHCIESFETSKKT